ncbi:MAG: DUF2141 domain-containing protein [Bacteroidota bacterium]|jgi:uncharacterized protein (DUF2141 family)
MKKHAVVVIAVISWIMLGSFSNMSVPDSSLEIRVVVKGIKPVTGNIGILLFKSKEGFPGDQNKSVLQAKVMVKSSSVEHLFSGLAPGRYAVSIVHDANNNGKLDTNFMGIPKEGYGVSNNAINSFGPPRYDESSFVLSSSRLLSEIKVHY